MTRTNPIDRGIVEGQTGHTEEPGLTTLLRQLGTDGNTLIRSEIALAKLEMLEVARRAALDGAKLGAALALVAIGGLALVAWLILALGDVLGDRHATAAAIVGVLFLAVGAILARKGLAGLQSDALRPEDTIETLKQDKQWLTEQVREFKSQVR